MAKKKFKETKFYQAFAKIAPKVAGALGGPWGGLAENVLGAVLGKSVNEVEAAIAAGDPNIFLDLKKAELEMEVRMEELEIEEQDLYLKDVADARAMRIATKDYTPAVLTGLAIAFFGVLSYAILWDAAVVGANEKFVWYLLGAANGLVVQGFNFFLGSSRGSQRKDTLLASGGGK